MVKFYHQTIGFLNRMIFLCPPSFPSKIIEFSSLLLIKSVLFFYSNFLVRFSACSLPPDETLVQSQNASRWLTSLVCLFYIRLFTLLMCAFIRDFCFETETEKTVAILKKNLHNFKVIKFININFRVVKKISRLHLWMAVYIKCLQFICIFAVLIEIALQMYLKIFLVYNAVISINVFQKQILGNILKQSNLNRKVLLSIRCNN